MTSMTSNLASAITKAASKQTYYTIRFLVTGHGSMTPTGIRLFPLGGRRPRRRCVLRSGPGRRRAFARELDSWTVRNPCWTHCLRGEAPRDADPHEAMLVELVRHADPSDARLEAYLRHMMLVMDFDVRRRGRLVSQAELDEYTRWLATAVTEAMHYFIGNGAAAPDDEHPLAGCLGRAHPAHAPRHLRGRPCRLLQRPAGGARGALDRPCGCPLRRLPRLGRGIACDLHGRTSTPARSTSRGVHSRRHRLAGLAYIARFEWLIETLEQGGLQAAAAVRRTTELRDRGCGSVSIWPVPWRARGRSATRRPSSGRRARRRP